MIKRITMQMKCKPYLENPSWKEHDARNLAMGFYVEWETMKKKESMYELSHDQLIWFFSSLVLEESFMRRRGNGGGGGHGRMTIFIIFFEGLLEDYYCFCSLARTPKHCFLGNFFKRKNNVLESMAGESDEQAEERKENRKVPSFFLGGQSRLLAHCSSFALGCCSRPL
jgi:hypothetical protein